MSTPRKKVADKRAPVDEQPYKLSEAEESGILPDEDRREEASEPESTPEVTPEPPVENSDHGALLHQDNAKAPPS